MAHLYKRLNQLHKFFFYLDTAFTKYTGSGEVGKNGSSTFKFIGGTGKYKSISGTGTVTRIQIQAAKKGYTQSKNIFKGNYKLK